MNSDEQNRSIDGSFSYEKQVGVPIFDLERSLETMEETSNSKQWKKTNLFLEIPTRSLDISPQEFVQITMPPAPTPTSTSTSTPKRVNFFLTPTTSDSKLAESSGLSSTRSKSSFRNMLPKLSFKSRGSNLDLEKAASIDSASSTQDKPTMSRSWSFSNIFTPRIKRIMSFPITSMENSNPDSVCGVSTNGHRTHSPKEVRGIARSLSVPVLNKEKGIQKTDSFFRVIPTPRPKEGDSEVFITAVADHENNEANGEDIHEEEAVCRICFVELCEGGETLKLECSCKGELALAHEECAVKWFSIKGNKTCDICQQEVRNLSVTLLRIESSVHSNVTGASSSGHIEINGYRVWQEVPILVIVSMLAYFCFFEQLLVEKMGGSAIAVSLPFSCVLGLISSMTSSTMVKRRFVWVYASIQFALMVLFAHIFYDLVHMQAIISVLLSTFAGFGFAMCGSSVLVEVLRWRRRRNENQLMRNHTSRLPLSSQTESASNISSELHSVEV